MNLRKPIAATAAGALAIATVGLFAAPTASASDVASPYETAAGAPASETLEAEPEAIPGIVAAATFAVRGFTAAKAPQQVGQVLRQASFLHNFMGGASTHLRSNAPAANIEVIFDH